MNNVQIIGRLTKDPEVRYTQEGKAVARFTVAVTRPMRQDEADFISCVAFGKTAEVLEKYFTKGKPIGLTGRIQTGSFEKDGAKHYTTDVIADRIEFLPADKAAQNGGPQGAGEAQEQQPAPDYDIDIPF